jgi:hypothetical protein
MLSICIMTHSCWCLNTGVEPVETSTPSLISCDIRFRAVNFLLHSRLLSKALSYVSDHKRYIPEGCTLHNHPCENVKSCKIIRNKKISHWKFISKIIWLMTPIWNNFSGRHHFECVRLTSEWVTPLFANHEIDRAVAPFDILVETWEENCQLSRSHFRTRCLHWSKPALTRQQSALLMWINCVYHKENCIMQLKLHVKFTETEQRNNICNVASRSHVYDVWNRCMNFS